MSEKEIAKQPVKPGVKTSEFYLTLAVNLVSILIILGVITPEHQQVLQNAMENINNNADAIGLFAGITNGSYIISRGMVKKS